MPTFWKVFTTNGFWIWSKAFSASSEITIWCLYFSWLICCITLIDLCILKSPWIPGINLTWSWCMNFLMCCWIQFASILSGISFLLFSHQVLSDSLWPCGRQHARLPCPSPTPGVCSNACPSSQWRHPAISSSVIPFSSCLQSFPASGSFPMSQLFAWGGQRIGLSASASVLPMNTQDWSPLGRTGWISLLSKGLLQHHHGYLYAYNWISLLNNRK